MGNIAPVGLVPGLVLPDVRKQLDELRHVALIGGHARHLRGSLLRVIKGHQNLLMGGCRQFNPVSRSLALRMVLARDQRVNTRSRVIRGDVAGDFRVQLLPQRVCEHLALLVADARHEGGGRVRAGRFLSRAGLTGSRRAQARRTRTRGSRAGVGGGDSSYRCVNSVRRAGLRGHEESYDAISLRPARRA